jgi:antitoxin component YwqK of YwqJK toxin-antitoxin module
MKWYFYILMLMTLACNSKVTITEDEVGADILYTPDTFKPFTGECIVVYNNTSLVKEQFSFKRGFLHGKALTWYNNGQIHRSGYYHKGQISGRWEFWDEQGHKTIEACYNRNVLNGSYMALYANGKLKEKGQFLANKRTGKWTYYSEDGQLLRSDTK